MTRDVVRDRWRERPVLGASLQALLTVSPLAAGVAVGLAVRSWLVGPFDSVAIGWIIAGVAAMATVWALQPLVRRLVPLAWLLTLGMLWPGRAPSRFRVARRAGRIRDLEDRLAHAREHGVTGEAEEAAELILSLATALTAHDRRTRGHAERVRVFTDLLALELGLPRHDRDRLRWAALLHDIGKLEVPERVLNKAGKPSPREWETLKAHPEAGDRIMAPLRAWLGSWADTALHHHERWDGTGYPRGLAGGDISLGGRIVAVADAYDVMTAARSYKRPMSAASAREELVACSGSQFDPAVVRALLLVPSWRLRWALGPFAWVAQLPLAREAIHAGSSLGTSVPAAGAAAGAAVGATVVLVGGSIQPTSGSDVPPQAAAEASEPDVAEGGASGSAATTAAGPREDTAERTSLSSARPGAAEADVRAGDRELATFEPPSPTESAAPASRGAPVSEGGTQDEREGTSADGGVGDTRRRVVDDTTGAVGQVIEDTVGTAAKAVDDTTTTLDKVVDDTTGTVAKVVEDTTGTVGSVVNDPVGSVGKVVEDTTGTVGTIVDDTTGTVGKVVDDTSGTGNKVVDDATKTVGRLLGRR